MDDQTREMNKIAGLFSERFGTIVGEFIEERGFKLAAPGIAEMLIFQASALFISLIDRAGRFRPDEAAPEYHKAINGLRSNMRRCVAQYAVDTGLDPNALNEVRAAELRAEYAHTQEETGI